MTVETQVKKVGPLPGNSSTFTYSFSPMVVFASTQLVVVHTVTATGVETVLTEGTGASNYSVNITTYPATGSITYPADEVTPIPSTETITIKRVLTLEQATDLQNQGGYLPENLETQMDKLLMIDLQQQELLERAVLFPLSITPPASTETTGWGASKYLRVNSAGTGLEWATLVTSTTTADASDATPTTSSLTAAAAGSGTDFSRDDHTHLLPTISIAKGGTDSTNAADARIALGLEIGVDVADAAATPSDAELAAIAGLVSADDKIIQFTGSGTAKLIDYLDDDTQAANSAEAVVSQQSLVAYIATQIATVGGGITAAQYLTASSGTPTYNASTSKFLVIGVGAGGAGGAGDTDGCSDEAGGGGGGGGGCSAHLYTIVGSPATNGYTSTSFTYDAGGGGAAITFNAGAAGTAGSGSRAGGAGGSASGGGLLNLAGTTGAAGKAYTGGSNASWGGHGGSSSIIGAAGGTTIWGTAGNAGGSPGGGGSGGAGSGNAGGAGGGHGILILEFA